MKNLKLRVKIGLGFGALLLISFALGIMAIISMRDVAVGANRLAKEYMPEVSIANDIERHSLMLMFAMRGYSMRGLQSYWEDAQQELNDVKLFLSQARAHSEKYPMLVKLKEDELIARKKLKKYEEMINEVKILENDILNIRSEMDSAAGAFMKNATGYLNSQDAKFKMEIEDGAFIHSLVERRSKISLIGEVISLGNSIRVMNFKSQAKNDPAIMQQALEKFPDMDKKIESIKSMTHEDSDLNSLKAINEDVLRYKKAMESMLAIWQKREDLNQRQSVSALDVLNAAKNVALAGLENTKKIADNGVSNLMSAQILMLIGLAVALVLGIALSVIIAKAITKPILASVSFAEKVAGGNLDDHLLVDQKDEIGKLADSLRKMVINLKNRILEANSKSDEAAKAASEAETAMLEAKTAQDEAIAKSEAMVRAAGRLQTVAEITTAASEELSAQIEQSSKGAEQQAHRVTETATAMEEMNATVLEVAKNASDAAGISNSAREKAQEGAAIVGKVVKGIGDVQKQSLELKNDMAKLGSQAESIGQIIAVISDIADQTNLLALNAAIEAARAGEAGRGFAVVADEVRKLAEKTMSATKEVGDAIRGIQDGTYRNMANVDRSVETIGEATGLANQSGEALNSIVHLVERTADQVRAIAAASEEQSATSEEINRSIEDVNVISNETADAMGQAAQAVMELARQSQELKTLIGEMRSGDTQLQLPAS